MEFVIPSKIVKVWGLDGGEVLNIEWSISDDPHPHKYARTAEATDDGSRVGIHVCFGKKSFWLQRTRGNEQAIKIANTLYDLMTEEVVGNAAYEWDTTR